MPVSVGDRAGVADLTAALGVERRPVEEHLDERAAVVRCGRNDGEHAPPWSVLGVADELGDAELLDHLAVGIEVGVVAPPLRRAALARSRCSAISVSKPATSTATSRSPAISCVSSSGNPYVSWSRKAPSSRRARRPRRRARVEDRQAVAQRLAEPLLLLAEHTHDEVALAGDIGIGGCPSRRSPTRRGGHDELLGAEQVGVAHGPADDPAQHEAAGLVAGEHAVADEHRRASGRARRARARRSCPGRRSRQGGTCDRWRGRPAR